MSDICGRLPGMLATLAAWALMLWIVAPLVAAAVDLPVGTLPHDDGVAGEAAWRTFLMLAVAGAAFGLLLRGWYRLRYDLALTSRMANRFPVPLGAGHRLVRADEDVAAARRLCGVADTTGALAVRAAPLVASRAKPGE